MEPLEYRAKAAQRRRMILAFSRALSDMMSRTLLVILAKSAALAVLMFVVLGIGIYALLDWSDVLEGAYGARFDYGFAGVLYGLAAAALVIVGLWFLFRIVMIAVIGLFADDIMDDVEARHYPHAQGSGPGVVRGTKMAARSLWRLLWVNLVASPVYLLLLVTGIGTAIAFLVVNGWAFGRDLDDAVRYRVRASEPLPGIAPLPRFLLGVGATFATGLPLIQIVVPVFAVALAAHLAHERPR